MGKQGNESYNTPVPFAGLTNLFGEKHFPHNNRNYNDIYVFKTEDKRMS